MSTTTIGTQDTAIASEARVLARLLDEGYGPGAWHGADLKAALADVDAKLAFLRPAPGRHNIAEIALHHAYYVHSVRGRLAGVEPEPFVLEGDDWFTLDDEKTLAWSRIREVVETEQRKLAAVVEDLAQGRTKPALDETERFNVVLGITCHAVYHAGQVQLIKVLAS
jgi:hypothetical protein